MTNKDGEELYRDYYFIMDEAGNGLRIDLITEDEFTLDDMRDGLIAYEVSE